MGQLTTVIMLFFVWPNTGGLCGGKLPGWLRVRPRDSFAGGGGGGEFAYSATSRFEMDES